MNIKKFLLPLIYAVFAALSVWWFLSSIIAGRAVDQILSGVLTFSLGVATLRATTRGLSGTTPVASITEMQRMEGDENGEEQNEATKITNAPSHQSSSAAMISATLGAGIGIDGTSEYKKHIPDTFPVVLAKESVAHAPALKFFHETTQKALPGLTELAEESSSSGTTDAFLAEIDVIAADERTLKRADGKLREEAQDRRMANQTTKPPAVPSLGLSDDLDDGRPLATSRKHGAFSHSHQSKEGL